MSDKTDDAEVLITDFGLSAILPEDGSLLHDAVGTPSYIGSLFCECNGSCLLTLGRSS